MSTTYTYNGHSYNISTDTGYQGAIDEINNIADANTRRSELNKVNGMYKAALTGGSSNGGGGDTLTNAFNGANAIDSGIESLLSLPENLKRGFDDLIDVSIAVSETWNEVDAASSVFSKQLGLGGKQMDALRDSSIDLVNNLKLAEKYGIDATKLIEMRQTYDENLGRKVSFNEDAMVNLSSMENVMGAGKGVEFASKMDQFGISAKKSLSYANSLFSMANKTGLSFKKLSETFSNNIKMASKYTFQDGIRGLERMAQKSLEIGLNMETAGSIADRMMDGGVEAATEMGAQLQVLGGAFAQFGNPLTMLSNGLLDTEEMQDKIGEMVSEMAQYDSAKGEMTIDPTNRMRLRAAAKAMGVSYDELADSAMRQGTRNKIAHDLDMGGINVSDNVRELLMNLGTIENGKAGANINGKFYTAQAIANSPELQKLLQQENVSEEQNIAQIAMDLRDIKTLVAQGRMQSNMKNAQIVKNAGNGKFNKQSIAGYTLSNEYQNRQAYLGLAAGYGNVGKQQLNYGETIANAGGDIAGAIGSLFGPKGYMVGKAIGNIGGGLLAGADGLGLISGFYGNNAFGTGFGINNTGFGGILGGFGNTDTNATTGDNQLDMAYAGANDYSFVQYPTSTYSTQYYPSSNYYTNQYQNSSPQQQTLTINPTDLNVSGTLKIDADGSTFDFDELMKNEQFKRKLAEAVTEAMNAKSGQFQNGMGGYGYS